MQKKIIIGVIAFLILLPIVFRILKTDIKIKGQHITIDTTTYHIEGVLGPETTQQFLLKDKGISINTFSGDAFVHMLPLSTAEKLREQYGDFFKCNSQGAQQAIQNMQLAVLIANDQYTKKIISEAMNLVNNSNIPVVSISGSHLLITKHTYLKMNVEDDTGTILYFVKSINIVKPNYI